MSGVPCLTFQAMTASRTTPTLCVFVIMTGPLRKPESSTQVVPVISPLPLRVNQAAKTASLEVLPRGWMAVTPVRTGPLPTTSLPSPEMIVVWPTSTPLTSVMALLGPGVPSKGTPRSRARGLDWADAANVRATKSAIRIKRRNMEPPEERRRIIAGRGKCLGRNTERKHGRLEEGGGGGFDWGGDGVVLEEEVSGGRAG